eukprot:c53323_g1_i1 orf=70-807(+)
MSTARRATSRKRLTGQNCVAARDISLQRQELMNLNHQEVERRISAIRAIRDANIEWVLTQLRLGLSELDDSVLDMPLSEFLKVYCSHTEIASCVDGSIELRKILGGSDCSNVDGSFEFFRQIPGAAIQSSAFRTPTGLNFSDKAGAKAQLLNMYMQKNNDDQARNGILSSFKEETTGEVFFHTPKMELSGQSKIGVTPRTQRLPKRGEALLSINGSPLGFFGRDTITSIPEELPQRAKRELRNLL